MTLPALLDWTDARDKFVNYRRFRVVNAAALAASFTGQFFSQNLARDRIFLVSQFCFSALPGAGQTVLSCSLQINDGTTFEVCAGWRNPDVGGGGGGTVFPVTVPVGDMLVCPAGYGLFYNITFSAAGVNNSANLYLFGYELPRGTMQ